MPRVELCSHFRTDFLKAKLTQHASETPWESQAVAVAGESRRWQSEDALPAEMISHILKVRFRLHLQS